MNSEFIAMVGVIIAYSTILVRLEGRFANSYQ